MIASSPSPTFTAGRSRRRFLQTGALGVAALSLPDVDTSLFVDRKKHRKVGDARSVILILNVGGLSQLDTFDPKPEAPVEIRGPFRPMRTRADGFQVTELLPRHAAIANRFSVVRGCCHEAPPMHDIALNLAVTGAASPTVVAAAHVGSVVDQCLGARSGMPGHIMLSRLGQLGGGLHRPASGSAPAPAPAGVVMDWRSLDGGFACPSLPEAFACLKNSLPTEREPVCVRESYGLNRFGQSCLMAARLVEAGVRFVTLHTFTTVFDQVGWDCHGVAPFSSLDSLRTHVAPAYDRGFAALIEDLFQRGLLDSTLVCCLSEFGRTPKLNAFGGRDHWPSCWTSVFAGGGVQGGRAIGRSDDIGAYPADRPVTPVEILATLYAHLGIPLRSQVTAPDGSRFSILPSAVSPIRELFC